MRDTTSTLQQQTSNNSPYPHSKKPLANPGSYLYTQALKNFKRNIPGKKKKQF